MEIIVSELEAAAALQLTACSIEERKHAEEKILQLRVQSEPYSLCSVILEQSSNDFLLYEAGRCLSHAVVREWDSVFAPSMDNLEDSKAVQLLTFILDWAAGRGRQVSAAARQRVLGAVGALVRRAAAAHADRVAAAWRATFTTGGGDTVGTGRLTTPSHRPRILTNPPEDPGPPCPILVRLIEHIEALIHTSTVEESHDALKQKTVLDRCLLGLCILFALLDELSNAEDSAQLNLPLEAHIFLCARFQDFELVRLFHTLLCLTDRIVHQWGAVPVESISAEQNEIVFRLVSCLDSITSWDFLPRELVGFYIARLRRTEHDTCFRPSLRWSTVLGPDALPTTLLLLIKLHTWVRTCDLYGTRTLSCLMRLSSMTGPLTDPVTPMTGLNEPDSNGTPSVEDSLHQQQQSPPSIACFFHILTFMDQLSWWFQTEPDEPSNVLRAIPDQQQQAALRQECEKRLASSQSVPRICPTQMLGYELPLLSEIVQNIILRTARAWGPVETALALPASVAAGRRSPTNAPTTYQYALLALVVLDRFLARISTILMQCLSFAAKWSSDSDGDGALAHEAVERLFNSWIDLIESIPATGVSESSGADSGDDSWRKKSSQFASSVPLPLTVGDTHGLEQHTQQVAQIVQLIYSNATRLQTNLFQAFLISKLAADVGLREPWTDQDEDIDLDLDESDLTAWEDSLFAAGTCGLADPEQSCELLLRLIDERVAKLVQGHDNQTPDQTVIDLYEDLHWLLLVTGHFLVSGPALFTSVLRPGCTLDTEFSIPQALLRMGLNEAIDISASRCLLQLAACGQCLNPAEPWPPVTVRVDQVPTLIRLFGSITRLLWLQVSLGLGSAQLVEDNLWLVTRFAVAYLCHTVMDREALMLNKTRSPILTILQVELSEPPAAHRGHYPASAVVRPGGGGGGTNNDKENVIDPGGTDVGRVYIQGLLTCARLALERWSSEPQVIGAATRLIGVLSRNAPNPSLDLVCPAWYEICAVLMCGSGKRQQQLWPSLTADSVIDLVQSCLCGSWAIDKARLAPSLDRWQSAPDSEPLLLQLLHSLRDRLIDNISCFVEPGSGQAATAAATTVNSPAMDNLLSSLAALHGVARAVGWLASQLDTAMDLVSHVWTGVLMPALDSAAHTLIRRCHNSSEVVQALLSLFCDVADSCLVYLANVPSAQLESRTDQPQRHLSTDRAASSVFLNLTVTLCENYAKQNTDKPSFEPTAEDDRVAELRLLLTLLNRVLAHEFELRLSSCMSAAGRSSPAGPSTDCTPHLMCAADVSVVGLGYILPLITEALLMVPEVCRGFYSLVSYACELRVEGLAQLSASQLAYLSQLLRLGIFGSTANSCPATSGPAPGLLFSGVDSSVTLQCLEIFIALADYCLDVRARQQQRQQQPSREMQIAAHLVTNLGLDVRLLTDLFTLVTKDKYSVDLEAVFSAAILDFIHLDRDAYAQLVFQWLKDCGSDELVRQRLQDAFERLGCPTDPDDGTPWNVAGGSPLERFTRGFSDKKPSRINRLEFQQRFHTFVAEVRAFVCRG